MTDRQLSGERLGEGFARLVGADEPPLDLDASEGVAAGRRLLKRRRLLAAATTLTVCAVFAGTAAAVQAYPRSPGHSPLTLATGSPVAGPMNVLVAGLDNPVGGATNRRTDTVMVVHFDRAMRRASVISFPRDAYVAVRRPGGGQASKGKINSAFAYGGMPALTATVERLTGLTIDHEVQVDLAGIRKVTDAVGGVDVTVDATSYDAYRYLPADSPYPTTPCRDPFRRQVRHCVTFKKGTVHLDGQLAEYYVRQRTGLPGGDLDRVRREQQYLHALVAKLTSAGTLNSPGRLSRVLPALTGAVLIDENMPVARLALTLKDLGPADISYLTVPLSGFQTIPGVGAVVELDDARAATLFTALRTDAMAAYLAQNPPTDVTHGH